MNETKFSNMLKSNLSEISKSFIPLWLLPPFISAVMNGTRVIQWTGFVSLSLYLMINQPHTHDFDQYLHFRVPILYSSMIWCGIWLYMGPALSREADNHRNLRRSYSQRPGTYTIEFKRIGKPIVLWILLLLHSISGSRLTVHLRSYIKQALNRPPVSVKTGTNNTEFW
jgi:hypothetical protein